MAFSPVEFTAEDTEFCVQMGQKRNSTKKNQTFSRGWPPEVKHIMGVHSEYADYKFLHAEMDWNLYGNKGDKSKPDGVLPDGRRIISKAVGRHDLDIWIPRVCLDKANPTDVVVAFQVIPMLKDNTYVYTDLGFLGWLSVQDFIDLGEENKKHFYAAKSLPGKRLDRDICWVTSRFKLRGVDML